MNGSPNNSSGDPATKPDGGGGDDRFRFRGWHVALVLSLIGLFLLFYQGLWGDPSAIPTVLIGTPAPMFSGPSVVDGATIDLSHYRGKVVMVNFWASWCQECRVEHENLLALYNQFRANPDFVLIGVNYQDKLEDARQYLSAFGSPFQQVRDVKGTISIDYGVYGVPETFIIDRQGVIRHKEVGPIVGPSYSLLTERVLPTLLQGPGPNAS
ncbi:MAG TPA: redoxin domain-containing protein [Nitrospiria bacterium]|nr:redoxin domain-containing protein [Nitrospiria bacterium]